MRSIIICFSVLFLIAAGLSAQDKSSTKLSAEVSSHDIKPSAFVQAKGDDFIVGGRTFRFAGTNAYYLPNYEKHNPNVVNRALNAFEEAGISVVRMWAFYDGYDCGYSRKNSNENVIQTAPGEYSEKALRNLDHVIAKGKERGIRFILSFINYWDELGGICQYNTWDGVKNPSQNMHHFKNDKDTQRWFRNYIKMLTNRVNTVTGIAYKNEPAIFSWEIMNEAQYSKQGADPAALRNWYQEIARFIKSQDPNHMVATGEEGKEVGMNNPTSPYSVKKYSNTYVLRSKTGTSFKANTSIPEIDYATAHWYPGNWGFGNKVNRDLLTAQRVWLKDHIKIAEDLGKPFVLGEYGFPAQGEQKMQVYTNLWNHTEELKIDGTLLWQFTPDDVKCYEYGGNVCWPQGRKDYKLYKGFVEHIEVMNKLK